MSETSISHQDERCSVPPNDPTFQRYHDTEWGSPVSNDKQFFEKVCLEGFQSGLSWRTILHRRNAFRTAFRHFDPAQIIQFTDNDVQQLVNNAAIIRNARKIQSVINNAHRALELSEEFGSLAHFFWQFEPDPGKRPNAITRQWLLDNPNTPESRAMSAALKVRGWTFTGPTTMYALMQATGIVNDHVVGCPRRQHIDTLRNHFTRP